MQKPRFGIVALCDAAYQDALTGKSVIAGLYNNDIAVGEFPSRFQICFYAELLNAREFSGRITFEFVLDKKRLGAGLIDTSLGEQNDGPAIIIMAGIPVHVMRPSIFEVRISVDDGPSKALIKKKVSARATLELAE